MVITTRTIRCVIGEHNAPDDGVGTFELNINHLVHRIVVSHGAVVQMVHADQNLLLIRSSIVDGETLGIIPSHSTQFVLPPRLGINYFFDNPKSIRGIHTMTAGMVSSGIAPTEGTYNFIIEFHGP